MKSTIYLGAIIIIAGVIVSCKKNHVESKPTASLNVINAVIGGGNVKLNTNERDSAKAYNWKAFAIIPGADLKLYPTDNPTSPYYTNTKSQTLSGKIYSAFIHGLLPNVETIFQEENVPDFYKDSVFGVRVVNLSLNSSPVNVTLASDEATNVFAEVAYKEITDLVKFPLPNITSADTEKRKTVTFQVRDGSGALLTTYALPTSANSNYPGVSINLQRFKNISLVLKGSRDTLSGPNAFGVFPVPMSY